MALRRTLAAVLLAMGGLAPVACIPPGGNTPPASVATPPAAEQLGILTPPPPAMPRVNGPRVVGVRPGAPFLYTIPATGERPMTFAARGLPEGLALDAETGRVTGAVAKPGDYPVVFTATSARGTAGREVRIVVGDRIALTPPLGWNSWNSWGIAIEEAKIRAAAKAMAESGLIQHGWSYINLDDGWQGDRKPPTYALQAKQKMGDMKALADTVHGLGLRIGLYSTPWKRSYSGYRGESADTADGRFKDPDTKFGPFSFEKEDAKLWAEWGIDYLKYDWKPNDLPHARTMADALRATGRDVVFSLSNSAPFDQAKDWAAVANSWRTTGDLEDTWASVSSIGFSQGPWRPFAGPGHWNDADMLVVGQVGWGPTLRPTELTPNEQYTHISLWCLLASPLLVGCDLAQLDAFTLSLLTNDEVLDVDQDPLGRQAARVKVDGPREIWVRNLYDGSLAVGLFNRADTPEVVTVKWSDLGLGGEWEVRDLWRHTGLGVFRDKFEARVLVHGVVLVKLSHVEYAR